MIELVFPIGAGLIAYGAYGLLNAPKALPSCPLEMSFIPFSMHFINVRAVATKQEWDQLKSFVHKHSKNGSSSCQICKQSGRSQGFAWSLECHEQWSFNWDTRTMKLTGLMSLCPYCHKAIHYFRTKKMEKKIFAKVQAHAMQVNQIDDQTLNKYVLNALKFSKAMSGFSFKTFSRQWKMDLTLLNDPKYGHIFLTRRFKNDERKNCRTNEIH